MRLDLERVRDNARQATTEDLLDRVTVYRAGMEPEALDVIEDELRVRGIDGAAIEAHAAQREMASLFHPDGTAAMCSFCRRPAVAQGWGWHWLSVPFRGRRWRLLPLVPCRFSYCAEHRPG